VFPLLPMKKIHQRRKDIFNCGEGEVIFTPKYHIDMQIGKKANLCKNFRR
jgi:hypothetical protein